MRRICAWRRLAALISSTISQPGCLPRTLHSPSKAYSWSRPIPDTTRSVAHSLAVAERAGGGLAGFGAGGFGVAGRLKNARSSSAALLPAKSGSVRGEVQVWVVDEGSVGACVPGVSLDTD